LADKKKLMVLTRPEHDPTTFYCSEWAKEVIDEAKRKGLDYIDLKRERANKKEVEGILRDKQPGFIFFNGHGDEKTVCGHQNEPLIQIDLNEDLLKFKITYSIACSSAKELGRKAVEKGARAYIGYQDPFLFLQDRNKLSRPLEDEVAKPFFRASNEVPISIIKNKSVKEAFQRSQESYRREIIRYRRRHGEEPGTPFILITLLGNSSSLVFHGDGDATLQ